MKAILLNRILLLLAFVGLFVAGVLSLEAQGVVIPCGADGGCATIANHPSSKWGTIPVAYIGLGAYAFLAVLAAARALKFPQRTRPLITVGYAASAIGSVISLFLQYQAFFIIGAKCMWCISSAVIMIATFILHAMLEAAVDANPELEEGLANASGAKTDLAMIAGLPVAVAIGVIGMNSVLKRAEPINIKPEVLKQVVFVPEDQPHIYGGADAKVTIVEFADILCPACQRTSPQVKEFVTTHPGKVRLVYRHFPLQTIHPMAMVTASVSEIAAEKGKFWDFVIAQMGKGGTPQTADEIMETAQSIGLDVDYIKKRLSNDQDEAYGRVARDLATVKQLGITSTPTFFVMVDGKVKATLGSQEILDRLNSPEFQGWMNASGPGEGPTAQN